MAGSTTCLFSKDQPTTLTITHKQNPMRIAGSMALAAILFTSCTKETLPIEPRQTPEEKTVRFEIGRVSDYSQPGSANLNVDIQLHLSLQNRETGAYTAVWDTTYAMRPVTEFPQASVPLAIEKRVVNTKPMDQVLKASYNLRFWRNNIIQYQSAALIPLNTGHTVYNVPVNL